MAAARKPTAPAPGDARIPCPLCGGLIHPIAGRCKHCKHDLVAARGQRPAAAAALPPLAAVKGPSLLSTSSQASAAYAPQVSGPTKTIGNAKAHVVVEPSMGASILPPRESMRMQAYGTRARRRIGWPMIVIGVAVLAIVAAIVLMLWPPPKKADPGAVKAHGTGVFGEAPPAPDRMPLDPGASTPVPTPTPIPTPPSGNNGIPMDPNAPHANIDPPPDIDDPDFLGKNPPSPLDPDGLGGTTGSPPLQSGTAMLAAMVVHACDRVARCPNVDANVSLLCQSSSTFLQNSGTPPTCAAASRCLSHIDTMDCSSLSDGDSMSTSFFMSALTGVDDCMNAMSC